MSGGGSAGGIEWLMLMYGMMLQRLLNSFLPLGDHPAGCCAMCTCRMWPAPDEGGRRTAEARLPAHWQRLAGLALSLMATFLEFVDPEEAAFGSDSIGGLAPAGPSAAESAHGGYPTAACGWCSAVGEVNAYICLLTGLGVMGMRIPPEPL